MFPAFTYPGTKYCNELLIWAYPENLVEIGHLVEAVDELCGTGGQGTARDGRAGHGTR